MQRERKRGSSLSSPGTAAAPVADRDPQLRVACFTRARFSGEFRPDLHDAAALHVFHAAADHACVAVPAGWLSLCLVLRGTVHARSADMGWSLAAGRMLAWNEELVVRTQRGGRWIGVLGTTAAWRTAAAGAGFLDQVLPGEWDPSPDLARLVVRSARCMRPGRDIGSAPLAALAQVLWEDQRHLRSLMERCTGRSRTGRRRILVRLLRLRHVIRANPHRAYDMDAMCRLTNFSPWHLARVFRNVFHESPVQYATRLRLEHARELIEGSGLPFASVAEAVGFSCQSSFNRAFRRFYKATPGAMRTEAR